MDFFEFEACVLRLKRMLGVQTDREIAELLAMDASAFNRRKARGSFPEDRLVALAETRPDLGIDVEYVLAGQMPAGMGQPAGTTYSRAATLVANRPIVGDILEKAAVCNDDQLKVILAVLENFVSGASSPARKAAPEPTPAPASKFSFHGKVGNVADTMTNTIHMAPKKGRGNR